MPRTFLGLALKIPHPRNPLRPGHSRTVAHTVTLRSLLGRWNITKVTRGLCQIIPMPGAKERSGWPADPAPGMWPVHKGALLVPAGRASHAQAGLHPAGDGGQGKEAPQDSGWIIPTKEQSAQSWPHGDRRPGEGENCTQMGKIMSLQLTQLPWPGPCPPQALVEPLPHHSFGVFCKDKSPSRPEISPLSIYRFKCSLGVWAWPSLSAQGMMFLVMQIGKQGTRCPC